MTIEVEQLEREIVLQIAQLRADYTDMSYDRYHTEELKIVGMVKLLSLVTGNHYMFSLTGGLMDCGYSESRW